ncbi:MAG: metallophosphoesterase [Candidatus Thiodiazotropha lotti]|nr:metallophosphoesterase [Candidatus Thiodiazotropha lotti]
MSLKLLHLSDIHFKYLLDGTPHDLDHDVRNELKIDVLRVVKQTGTIDAIIVTGDIAFSGKSDEYKTAKNWLAELCAHVGCEIKNIWVVPGNHDIDRDCLTEIVRFVQEQIQNAPLSDLDKRIRKFIHEDPAGAAVLTSPLAEYYKFAAIYGCSPLDGVLAWQDDLLINMGYRIRLVGLNSALVSNNHDHAARRPLVLGQAQLDMPRTAGRLYVTLCHHPMSWLKDAEPVGDKLLYRSSLQLYGHVHEQALEQRNGTLIVQAGALQPERHEDPWYPSYNVLTLEIVETGNRHVLSVTAYPRIWSHEHHFAPDPSSGEAGYLHYILPIDEASMLGCTSDGGQPDDTQILENSAPERELEYSMSNPVKQLVYGFLTLPYSKQIRIANRLSLLADEDAGLTSASLFKRIFERAREQACLHELWVAVQKAQPGLDMTDNPYTTSGKK